MKYEFKKLGIDDYQLITKTKTFDFKRNVKDAKEFDSITARARIKLLKELSSMGMTKDDLIVKKTDNNGKIIIDESGYNQMEKDAIQEEAMNVFNKLIEEKFGIDFQELYKAIGIDITDDQSAVKYGLEIEKFSAELTAILTGKDDKTPSGIKK